MNPTDPAWEARVAALWATLDEHEPEAFIAHLDALLRRD